MKWSICMIMITSDMRLVCRFISIQSDSFRYKARIRTTADGTSFASLTQRKGWRAPHFPEKCPHLSFPGIRKGLWKLWTSPLDSPSAFYSATFSSIPVLYPVPRVSKARFEELMLHATPQAPRELPGVIYSWPAQARSVRQLKHIDGLQTRTHQKPVSTSWHTVQQKKRCYFLLSKTNRKQKTEKTQEKDGFV